MKGRMKAVIVGAAAVASSLALAAPIAQAEDTDVPTFREFRASTYQDVDGAYVVNGDESIRNLGELKRYYDRMVAEGEGGEPGDLVINTVNGVDDKWSSTQVGNLTYCVSDRFGTNKSKAVAAAAAGAAMWENASSAIDFRYVSSQDGNCTTANSNVVFSIEPVQTNQYLARAFFPSSPKSQRNVLVASDTFRSTVPSPGNILGHEFGHILGFRHEHTRPESGVCFEDNNWRPLTPYDSDSVMHYPQCNGTSNTLSFTSLDGQGVRAVYGS